MSQHSDNLQKASPDHVELTRRVKENIQELCFLQKRVRGTDLKFPLGLTQDVMRFTAITDRFWKGDFRYRQSEIDAVKALAEWSLILNAELRNQPLPKLPEWTI